MEELKNLKIVLVGCHLQRDPGLKQSLHSDLQLQNLVVSESEALDDDVEAVAEEASFDDQQ